MIFYPSTTWKYTVGHIRHRLGRTVLTVFGIVIGVATTVAISSTIEQTRCAYGAMFEAVGGRASLEVVAAGDSGFDGALASRLQQVTAVRAAVPLIQSPAALVGSSGPVPVLVLGIDPGRDHLVRDFILRQGEKLDDRAGILVEAEFARANGLQLGGVARLLTPRGMADLPVFGLLEAHSAAAVHGGAIVVMPVHTAQSLFALGDRINSVQLVLDEGTNPLAVEAEVALHLPAGLTVQTPASRGQLAEFTLRSTEQCLTTLSAVAVVAGAMLVLNAFLMNVQERRRQLAVLRVLGATRRQVTELLLREAALFGALGTALGVPIGFLLSGALSRLMEQLLGIPLPRQWATVSPALFGLFVGPATSVLATYFSARRASRCSVLEDLHLSDAQRGKANYRCSGFAVLALFGVTLVLAATICRGWYSTIIVRPLIALTVATGIVTIIHAIPMTLPLLTWITVVVFRPLFGFEGRLALWQLDRRRSRTSLTVAIMFVAVVISIGMGNALLDSLRAVQTWYDRTIVADFLVRGAMPDSVTGSAVALPERFADELSTLDGVRNVVEVTFIPSRANGQRLLVLARRFDPNRPLPLDLVEGERQSVIRGLLSGEVVVGSVLAQRLDLSPGGTLTLDTPQGPVALHVAGITTEYTVGGMAAYIDWRVAKRHFHATGVSVFLVTAGSGEIPRARAGLTAFCAERGLLLQTNADLRTKIDRMVGGVVAFLWVLMALVFLVAALGIVNTLAMNVLEQTRELGVLRAVGMTRGQVRRFVVIQALGFGLISLVPGIAVGLGLASVLHLSTYQLTGQVTQFRLHASLVAASCAVAMTSALLAAIPPARRAMRLQILEALRES